MTRLRAAFFVAMCAMLAQVCGATETATARIEGHRRRVFRAEETTTRPVDGFLFEGEDGIVRVGNAQPVVGMYGRWGGTFEKQLGAELGGRLRPLVNRIPSLRKALEPDIILMPGSLGSDAATSSSASAEGATGAILGGNPFPTILVCLAPIITNTSDVETTPGFRGAHKIQRIQEAEVISAEEIPVEWLERWKQLDQVLARIVSVSLEAPDKGKRKRLTDLIEAGSRLYHEMSSGTVSPRFRATVGGIAPSARVTRAFQASATMQWGRLLEQHAQTLGIIPPRPVHSTFELADLLEASDSPSAFRRLALETAGENAMDLPLGRFFEGLPSDVRGIEQMPSGEFQAMRTNVLEFRRQSRRGMTPENEDKGTTFSVPELGVTMDDATTETLARNLLLAGFVVVDVDPEPKTNTLQRGDVVASYGPGEYTRPFFWNRESKRQWVTNALKTNGLRVYRGGRLVVEKAP